MGSSVFLPNYQVIKKWFNFPQKLIWRNVIGISIIQLLMVYGFYRHIILGNIPSIAWGLTVGYLSAVGVSVGAHRLWTHKTYKAKLPLRIFLMFCYLLSGQYSLVQWARDHRLHHKCTDTDGDPHNAKRGFYFSHCGWLMMKRHPEVKKMGNLIDLSDLMEDPVVRFQQKYFVYLFIPIFIIFPSVVPALLWNENWQTCIFGLFFLRYGIQLNATWTVNSYAHMYGTKPYNKKIMAAQNKYVAFIGLGEGWHNYHHVFPWDYKLSDRGMNHQLGAKIIKLFEALGLAYDLKEASPEMVKKVMEKAMTTDPIYEVVMPESQKNNNDSAEIKNKDY